MAVHTRSPVNRRYGISSFFFFGILGYTVYAAWLFVSLVYSSVNSSVERDIVDPLIYDNLFDSPEIPLSAVVDTHASS